MSELNENWKPEFGTIFTWFAQDKFGRIAVMINNCFGDIPRSLLRIRNVEEWLDHATDFIWEDSEKYREIPEDKMGEFSVDLFSFWRNGPDITKEYLQNRLSLQFKEIGRRSDINLIVNRGFFEYQAVEGSYEGEDYPVGYEGQTKMGDYYRHLVPSKYASIEDFPDDLHHIICVSDTIDFTTDRVIESEKINSFFTRQFCNQ